MTFDEYQERAQMTAIYPNDMKIVYPALGINGEAGEIAEKVKKVYRDRDGQFTEGAVLDIAKECGDTLWYLAAISRDIGIPLSEIARMNLEKIETRLRSNTLHGNGDTR